MQILNGTLIEGLKDGARMNVGVNDPVYLPLCPGSTTQGGGGSFKKGNLYERLVVVMHGLQSEPTDGPHGGRSDRLSICLSICPSIYLPVFSISLSVYLPIVVSVYFSIYVCVL